MLILTTDNPRICLSRAACKNLLLVAALVLWAVQGNAAATVTFDFETGSPVPTKGTTTPFSYNSDGLLASFSSATVGESFSVQDQNSVGGANTLSLFFNKFLNPNSTARASLDINFSQQLSDITLTYATAQSTAVETPNPITLRAYLDSTSNPVGSPLTVSGSFDPQNTGGTEAAPSGTLTFSSASPFNMIEIVMGAGGAGGVLVDNISVTTVPEPSSLALLGVGAAIAGTRGFRRRTSTIR